MKIKDHFLSKEEFDVIQSDYDGILKTKGIPENIEKYYESNEYLSHNKNNSLKSKIYKIIQRFNEIYKLKIIKKYIQKGNILDYGCGDGSFLKFIKENNFSTLGYEPNKNALNISYSKIGKENIIYSLDEIENNSLDIITLWHVLEHIPNPEEILSNLKIKLKDKGIIIIAIPNFNSFDAQFYKEYWAAWDVPRHLFHYSKDGAINFFKKNNFNLINMYPLPFDSYYISMVSENYLKNPLGILRFFIIGLLSNIKGKRDNNYSSVIYILKKHII